MANEGELTLRFKVADDGSIVLDKIGKKISEVESNTKSMSKSLSLIKIDSLINLGERAYHAAEQVYRMGKEVAGALNDIERSAKVANMTTNEYQKMAYAAKMSDVSIEELSTGMKKLSVNMDEALKAGGPAFDMFERIGVSVKDSDGKMKSLNQIMLEIAEKFSTWEDGPRKIAIAVDLFGRSGERLIPYLNQGAAGIKTFYEEAEKLGIVLDEKLIKKGSELEDRFKKAESWWDSLKKKIVIGAYEGIEAIEKLIEKMGEAGAAAAERSRLSEIEWKRKRGYPESQIPTQPVSAGLGAEYEEAVKSYLQMEAYYKRVQAPAGNLKKIEEGIKILHEVDLQLLKDQEATLKRMVELQTKLNKSGDEAIEIAERLGVTTKAAFAQWIQKDIVGEYEKLLGSKLFSTEETEQFKTKYTEALKSAKGEGGWGSEYKQIEEAIEKIQTMKVENTSIQKTRAELEQLTKYAQYLETFTGQIKLDDNDLVRARDQIIELKRDLTDLVNKSWNVTLSIYGYGSTEKPILEKIEEVQNAFQTMGSEVGNMVLQMNLSQMSAEISELQKRLSENVAPIWASNYMKKGIEVSNQMYRERIAELQNQQKMLTAGAAYTSEQGSYEGGEVSININTININGGEETVAEQLDAELADLWYKNRSKLRVAIQG